LWRRRTTAGFARVLAERGALVVERVGYDGPDDGLGCVPAGNIDGDNADDLVGRMRADDAGGPAPCCPAGCRREASRAGKPAVLARNRDGDVVPAGWFVLTWHHKPDI
jgi:hypothetical protein